MTIEEIANAAIQAVGSPDGVLTAAQFVQRRYRQLAQRVPLRHLFRLVDLRARAAISVGEVEVTQFSRIVKGDATARAAWAAAGDALQGALFKAGSIVDYEIEALSSVVVSGVSQQCLLLKDDYLGASDDELGHSIVFRYITLPPDLQLIAHIYYPRHFTRLDIVSPDEAALRIPDRSIRSGGPYLAIVHDYRRLELYPPAGTQEDVIRLSYFADPGKFALTDRVPDSISEALTIGTQADLLRRMAMEAAKSSVDRAGFLRNESHAIETMWKDACDRASMADAITGDKSLELTLIDCAAFGYSYDPVTTAQDDVFRRWNV